MRDGAGGGGDMNCSPTLGSSNHPARGPDAQVWPCQLSSVHKPCTTPGLLMEEQPGTLPFQSDQGDLESHRKMAEPLLAGSLNDRREHSRALTLKYASGDTSDKRHLVP